MCARTSGGQLRRRSRTPSRSGRCAGGARHGKRVAGQEQVREAEAARYELSTMRFKNGVSSELDRLDAQRQLFTAEQALVQARQLRLNNAIDLYRALGGGGWRRARWPPRRRRGRHRHAISNRQQVTGKTARPAAQAVQRAGRSARALRPFSSAPPRHRAVTYPHTGRLSLVIMAGPSRRPLAAPRSSSTRQRGGQITGDFRHADPPTDARTVRPRRAMSSGSPDGHAPRRAARGRYGVPSPRSGARNRPIVGALARGARSRRPRAGAGCAGRRAGTLAGGRPAGQSRCG